MWKIFCFVLSSGKVTTTRPIPGFKQRTQPGKCWQPGMVVWWLYWSGMAHILVLPCSKSWLLAKKNDIHIKVSQELIYFTCTHTQSLGFYSFLRAMLTFHGQKFGGFTQGFGVWRAIRVDHIFLEEYGVCVAGFLSHSQTPPWGMAS